MCMRGWHVIRIDGVQETHGWHADEVKSPLGKEKWVGLVHGSQRGLEAHREANMWVKSHIE